MDIILFTVPERKTVDAHTDLVDCEQEQRSKSGH